MQNGQNGVQNGAQSGASAVSTTAKASKRGEARRQVHNALQWLVRIASSYAKPEPDARHMLLRWDRERQAFTTRPFGAKLAVELRPVRLEMQFTEGGRRVPHVLYMEERSPAQVEAWVLVELLHRGLSRATFSKDLPYDIPNLMTGDQEEYSPESVADELEDLTAWIDAAAKALSAIKSDWGAAGPGTSGDLVCWPAPFHVGLTAPFKNGKGDGGLRVALCAGSDAHDEPFFFVAPDGRAAQRAYDEAAVLPVSRISGGAKNIDAIAKFLRAAIAAAGTSQGH